MNQIIPAESRTLLLDDGEFATLMIAEYTAESRSKNFVSRVLFRSQIGLWAAGMGMFVVYHPQPSLNWSEEFSLTNVVPASGKISVQEREKSGGASVQALPSLTVGFDLAESSGQPSKASSSGLSALEIRTRRIRRVRVEIHENGRLSKVRELDPLSIPTEHPQPALVRGQQWGFAFDAESNTLICVKPSDAPPPPERLSVEEMRQRAALFPNQCFFRERG